VLKELAGLLTEKQPCFADKNLALFGISLHQMALGLR
jgi:hypothetical protein